MFWIRKENDGVNVINHSFFYFIMKVSAFSNKLLAGMQVNTVGLT